MRESILSLSHTHTLSLSLSISSGLFYLLLVAQALHETLITIGSSFQVLWIQR